MYTGSHQIHNCIRITKNLTVDQQHIKTSQNQSEFTHSLQNHLTSFAMYMTRGLLSAPFHHPFLGYIRIALYLEASVKGDLVPIHMLDCCMYIQISIVELRIL